MKIKNNHYSTLLKLCINIQFNMHSGRVYILYNNNKRLIYFSHKKNVRVQNILFLFVLYSRC